MLPVNRLSWASWKSNQVNSEELKMPITHGWSAFLLAALLRRLHFRHHAERIEIGFNQGFFFGTLAHVFLAK
jgi:hypothetical protein